MTTPELEGWSDFDPPPMTGWHFHWAIITPEGDRAALLPIRYIEDGRLIERGLVRDATPEERGRLERHEFNVRCLFGFNRDDHDGYNLKTGAGRILTLTEGTTPARVKAALLKEDIAPQPTRRERERRVSARPAPRRRG